MGLLGCTSRATNARGSNAVELRARVPGARGRGQRLPVVRACRGRSACSRSGSSAPRSRRSAGCPPWPGASDRLLRPDRARRRVGPWPHAHERPARRGRLDPVGDEDVDHQRQRGRPRDRAGRHRRRDPRVPRPDRAPGFSANDVQLGPAARASVTSELVLDEVRLPADAALPGVTGLRGRSPVCPRRGSASCGFDGAARACFESALARDHASSGASRSVGSS